MNERRLRVVLPLAILAVGVVVTVVLVRSRPPVPRRPRADAAPLVRVARVEPARRRVVVRTQGVVEPRTSATLAAEAAGRIVATTPSFAPGGRFARGDTLVRIDPRDYELAVVAARAQVAQARLRLETEQAQAEVAREEWRRLGGGGDSPLATRRLQVAEARAALEAAEAALERARTNLARTRVVAAYDGRVREKLADVGQYVAPGTPVARVYAIDAAEVRLPVADADLARLGLPPGFMAGEAGGPGPEVILSAGYAGARRRWTGRLVRVEGEIDAATRMVRVVARIDDPYGRGAAADRTPLPVGLFVDAEILGEEVDGAVVLPRSALRADSTVLVVDAENRVRVRPVTVFRVEADSVVITAGLSRGERVCLSTLAPLTDGTRVRVFGEDAPADGAPASPEGGEPDAPPEGAGGDAATAEAGR